MFQVASTKMTVTLDDLERRNSPTAA